MLISRRQTLLEREKYYEEIYWKRFSLDFPLMWQILKVNRSFWRVFWRGKKSQKSQNVFSYWFQIFVFDIQLTLVMNVFTNNVQVHNCTDKSVQVHTCPDKRVQVHTRRDKNVQIQTYKRSSSHVSRDARDLKKHLHRGCPTPGVYLISLIIKWGPRWWMDLELATQALP